MKKIIAAIIGITLFGSNLLAGDFTLSSKSFKKNSFMPAKLARKSGNISPQLGWSAAPEGTKSFVITCIDIHPVARRWVHWMVINIPSTTKQLQAGASGKEMPPGVVELKNSFRTRGYGGPQPPSGTGVHKYVFTIYALDVPKLSLNPAKFYSEKRLLQILRGKILTKATTTGKLSKD